VVNRTDPPASTSFAPGADRKSQTTLFVPQHQALTPEELDAVLKVVDDSRAAPLIRLALATGLRECELLGLRLTDVDVPARFCTSREPCRGPWTGDTNSRPRRRRMDPDGASGSAPKRSRPPEQRTLSALSNVSWPVRPGMIAACFSPPRSEHHGIRATHCGNGMPCVSQRESVSVRSGMNTRSNGCGQGTTSTSAIMPAVRWGGPPSI